MDAYTYMLSGAGWKYGALSDADAPPPPRRRRRQCDVSQGQPLADIARTLGHTQPSRCTGESLEEWAQRHPALPEATP